MVDRLVRLVAGASVEAKGVAIPPDVQVRRSRLVPLLGGLLAGMRRPAAAVTLGRTILVHPSAPLGSSLLRHELVHVEQWKRHPFTFPFRYTRAHIRWGYDRNPYEAEARAGERPGIDPGEHHDTTSRHHHRAAHRRAGAEARGSDGGVQ